MRKASKLILVWITLSAYCLGVGSSVALAASTTSTTPAATPTNNGQALEIAPPVIYLSVNPGQTLETQILIRDISSGNLLVSGQANDFVAAGEDGTPKILLNGDDSNNPYTMKAWVASIANLLLIPKQIKTLTITINVPANASPGGHYGVIRFTGTAPSLKNSGVSLSASLGALLLVTVSGKITENLSVQQFSVTQGGKIGTLFQSGPVNFVEAFRNTGNVHVQPTGQVSITDMFGNKLASVNINLPPGNILPSSIRKFQQPLDNTVIGNKRLFGRYTAHLKVTYGTSSKVLTASLVFWVIPWKLIIILIAVLIGGFFVLRYLLKRYNKHILAQAQKKPPRKP